MKRTVLLALLVLYVCPVAILSARVRDRRRIEVLELELAKLKAVLGLKLSNLEDEQKRLRAQLEERRLHIDKVEKRLAALGEVHERNLRILRDTLGKAIDGKVTTLENGLSGVRDGQAALKKDLVALRSALDAFKKSLSAYGDSVDGQFAKLEKELGKIKKIQDADREKAARSLTEMLKVVDLENKKMRRAIAGLSRSRAQGKSPARPQVHIVAPGENLYSIARNYGLTFQQLKKANPKYKSPSAVIHPGDELMIPTL